MSQILSAAKRSVRGKSSSEYEDLDRSQDFAQARRDDVFDGHDSLGNVGQELEMNSVSVVPDGMFSTNLYFRTK